MGKKGEWVKSLLLLTSDCPLLTAHCPLNS